MSSTKREIVILKEQEGLTNREIAYRLSITERYVEKVLREERKC